MSSLAFDKMPLACRRPMAGSCRHQIAPSPEGAKRTEQGVIAPYRSQSLLVAPPKELLRGRGWKLEIFAVCEEAGT